MYIYADNDSDTAQQRETTITAVRNRSTINYEADIVLQVNTKDLNFEWQI